MMVINYIILAHKEPEQVRRLVERLYGPQTFFYIHIDRNVDSTPFESLLSTQERVYFLPKEKRVDSSWGRPGIVEAALNGIFEVVKDNRFGYTVLASGQCYPIKSNAYIHSFLKENYGYNFIEGFPLPDPRWPASHKRLRHYTFFMSTKKDDFVTVPPFSDLTWKAFFEPHTLRKYGKVILRQPLQSLALFKKRRFRKYLKAYGGMMWWALPLETLKFIRRFVLENPGYLKYHLHTLIPDEIFFQTIVHNYFGNVYPPVTYVSWPTGCSASSPEILTTDHLHILKEKSELFARKFDGNVDSRVLDLIDTELLCEDTKSRI